MKKSFIIALCIMLASCQSALAWENLYSQAIVDEDGIYYSGSLDEATVGTFFMNADGSGARKLLDGEALLLAASDSALLTMMYDENYENGEMNVIARDGEVIASIPGEYLSSIEDDDRFYVANLEISVDGGTVSIRELFALDAVDSYRIMPVEVEDGYLYFQDSRDYKDTTYEVSSFSVDTLKRVSLAGGEPELICDADARFIGIDDGHIYFQRMDYYVHEGDYESSDIVHVECGLYRANTDGGDARIIADVDPESYLTYTHMDDGVIYGLMSYFDADTDEPRDILKRVTTGGEALADIDVPSDTLAAIDDGELYFIKYNYYESNGEEVQSDEIVIFDERTGEQTTLLTGRGYALFFTETQPQLVAEDGRVYFFDYSYTKNSMRLWSTTADGSGERLLAPGLDNSALFD
ncbi:MAG: hypothetical protein Q4D04_06490 [Clostridia bacterium]|nr:hypothetical protein [Clostridia bacterium]